MRLQHGQQRSSGDVWLGQVDGRQPQVGSHAAWRGVLRFIQLVGFVFGVIVVEFIRQLLRIVVVERQFVRLQQRIVKFLWIVFGFVLLVGQQFIGVFQQRIFKW